MTIDRRLFVAGVTAGLGEQLVPAIPEALAQTAAGAPDYCRCRRMQGCFRASKPDGSVPEAPTFSCGMAVTVRRSCCCTATR